MRVLLIEDHPPDIWLIKRQFGRIGVRLTVAQTGPEGVRHALANRFDLILLDLNLPVLNGFEVLERLHARSNQTPVVILTSSKTETEVLRAYNLGANAYTIKPTDKATLDDLLTAINDFWQHNVQVETVS